MARIPDQGLGPLPADYEEAVMNAFATAPVLAAQVNALPGGSKTIVGHSLACGVISSAMSDLAAPMIVNHVCFIDGALPREAFDGPLPQNTSQSPSPEQAAMTRTEWVNYDPRLWAANWYQLFPATDSRSGLTWANRFIGPQQGGPNAGWNALINNFYSSTEDVLAPYAGGVTTGDFLSLSYGPIFNSGLNSWVFQEKLKGTQADFQATHLGSKYGGWGFNLTDPADQINDPIYYWLDGAGGRHPLDPGQIPDPSTQTGQALFQRLPLFDPGYGQNSGALQSYDPSVLRGPNWLPALFSTTTGSATAAIPANRAQLLAEAIPALSWPVGSQPTSTFTRLNATFDMPRLYVNPNATWPLGNAANQVPNWHHSNVREVAYIYMFSFYSAIVGISNP